ncbi:PIN2/TERF1-interacting telomerase inhibitor 1 isoform X2 [Eupeodes corollae]|uniref:PIN2/TERF1-interacting telomerase inhibitor 1 isoform X2 n=1 Tax=Eupeodes corollae TaxID=290404 RepID=UPI002491A4C0|nr:PIN2/TERF1-interacting telomerase inhibitor 1 isoform X2 [Eupeodes corollae]
MAMLAEPRQKRRYHLTPKGKPLFEDTDRFGTKMLEKMGWSKGKGLGKSEDGTQDFVRVKYKSDERGLGFQVRDDQWTEHDKNFNGLLQNLNGGVDGNGEADPSPEECDIITPTVGLGFAVKSSKNKKLKEHISGQSLEEKSKKSKARVHYQKFTKGKDMSQYSEKDLANIFGKKASPDETNIYSQFQAFNAGGSDSDDKKVSEPEEPAKVLPPIINTGVSVNDYFKAKMAALKEKQGGSESSNPFNSNVRVINNVEYVIPKAKRKRSTDGDGSENEGQKVPSKKSKTLEEEEPQEQESEEAPPKKKKKKSKKHSAESEETEVIPSADVEKEESQKEKKKKRKKAAELEETIIDEIKEQETTSNEHQPDSNSESSSSKKNKKKSKKSREEDTNKNEEDIQTTPCPLVVEDNDVPKKKKKKDKKNSIIIDLDSEEEKEETPKNTNDTPKSTSEVNNIKSTKSKLKKNKKSKTERNSAT